MIFMSLVCHLVDPKLLIIFSSHHDALEITSNKISQPELLLCFLWKAIKVMLFVYFWVYFAIECKCLQRKYYCCKTNCTNKTNGNNVFSSLYRSSYYFSFVAETFLIPTIVLESFYGSIYMVFITAQQRSCGKAIF